MPIDPRKLKPSELCQLTVEVVNDGFRYQNITYKSLSAVAKAITGTNWNGFHFFNLRGAK